MLCFKLIIPLYVTYRGVYSSIVYTLFKQLDYITLMFCCYYLVVYIGYKKVLFSICPLMPITLKSVEMGILQCEIN